MQGIKSRYLLQKMLAVLCLLCLLFTSTACSLRAAREDSYPVGLEDGKLTALSLVQAIVSAINGDSQAKSVYLALSNRHVKNLSVDEFNEYIRAFRLIEDAKVISVSRLAVAAEEELRDSLEHRLPLLTEAIEETIFYELYFNLSELNNVNFTLGIQLDESGEPYLDGDWVRSILRVSDYAQLYFEAIDKGDKDDLAWLLSTSTSPALGDRAEEFSREKAKLILRFYRNNVTTEAVKSKLLSILPGKLTFGQNYRINQYTTAERELEIREEYGNIVVREAIREELRPVDRILYVQGERVFTGDQSGKFRLISSENISAKLGGVKRIYRNDPDNSTQFIVEYVGIALKVDGEFDYKKRYWKGEVQEIIIDSPRFSFGPQLRVGMPAGEFFLRYPFAGETDYTMEAPYMRGKVNLTVQFSSGEIDKLIWQYR
ncbi:MAG: hypothetical protein Q4P65_01175 [Eubacteriales bacterium]|nr:hypothetical protein [Eubacteriales bacterium]